MRNKDETHLTEDGNDLYFNLFVDSDETIMLILSLILPQENCFVVIFSLPECNAYI